MIRAWRTTPATFPPETSTSTRRHSPVISWGSDRSCPSRACSRVAEPLLGEATNLQTFSLKTDGSLRKARLSPLGLNSPSPSKPSISPTGTSTYFANWPRPPSPDTESGVESSRMCCERTWSSPHFFRNAYGVKNQSSGPVLVLSSCLICPPRPTCHARPI